jgi:hypothetical protein
MKTRKRETGTAEGLPPPPAPTARDANPWSISSQEPRRAAARQFGQSPVPGSLGGEESRSPATLPSARTTRKPSREHVVAGSRPRRAPLFALVVPASMAAIALFGAVRALESGNYLEAVGPLLLVAFVVFVVFRVMRRRS